MGASNQDQNQQRFRVDDEDKRCDNAPSFFRLREVKDPERVRTLELDRIPLRRQRLLVDKR